MHRKIQKEKKKALTTLITTGVVTQLKSNILECEVNWTLGSITMNKASGGDRNPAELFQIPRDDHVKMLHSIRY